MIKDTQSTEKNTVNIRNLTTTALMCSVLCVVSPFSIPIGPVPVSLSLLAVYLCVFVLKKEQALTAVFCYILLGLAGLPVFSGFSGGVFKLFGPTGGYIIGYIPLVFITGFFVSKYKGSKWYMHIAGAVLGLIACYALGTVWFSFSMNTSFRESLTLCVYPFIAFDLVKIMCAYIVGTTAKAILQKANLI